MSSVSPPQHYDIKLKRTGHFSRSPSNTPLLVSALLSSHHPSLSSHQARTNTTSSRCL